MTNEMPRFAAFSHRRFLGYVNAVSHKDAVKRASRLFAAFAESLEVELATNRNARPSDRINANVAEQGKRNRRYTDAKAFEQRRRALIAECLG